MCQDSGQRTGALPLRRPRRPLMLSGKRRLRALLATKGRPQPGMAMMRRQALLPQEQAERLLQQMGCQQTDFLWRIWMALWQQVGVLLCPEAL
jgi:hypothetical protein